MKLVTGSESTGGRGIMRKRYTFAHLSRWEREIMESILMEEIEFQTWFSTAWSELMGVETIITLQ
jgi:hypothetical protein